MARSAIRALLLILSFSHIQAEQIPMKKQSQDLAPHLEYLDRGSVPFRCESKTLEKLDSLPWKSNSSRILRLESKPDGNWIRFSLKNPDKIPLEQYLVLYWLNVHSVELCTVSSDGKVELSQSGYDTPALEKPVLTSYPCFQISLPAQTAKSYYLHIDSDEDLNYPVRLLTLNDLLMLIRTRSLIIWLIGGVLMLALLFNTVQFLRLREWFFLSFAGMLLLTGIAFFLLHGQIFVLIPSESRFVFKYGFFFYLALAHFAFYSYLYTLQSKNSQKSSANIYFYLAAILGSVLGFIPFSENLYHYRDIIFFLLVSISIFFAIRIHTPLMKQKRMIMNSVYVQSWLAFIILGCLKVLYHFDLLPYSIFSVYGIIYYLPFHTVISDIWLTELALDRNKGKSFWGVSNPRKSTIGSLDVPKLKESIDTLLKDKKIYLQKSLKEEDLAKEIGIGNHQLSELINIEFKTTFPSLLNQYRVEEAKKLLLEMPDVSSAEIGSMAGFSSRSSFHLEFKKLTGKNPSAFRRDFFPNF